MAERTPDTRETRTGATAAGRSTSSLRATPPLDLGRHAIELREVTDLALVTIALPEGRKPGTRTDGRSRTDGARTDGARTDGTRTDGTRTEGAPAPGDAVRDRLSDAFGISLPAVGHSVVTDRGERLLGLQADRLYVLFEHPGTDADDAKSGPEGLLRARLGARDPEATASDTASDTTGGAPGAADRTLLYSSDQSDSWVVLRLDGAASRRALERVCPLDLHPDVFPIGAVARSVVEHLGVVVLRVDENAFLLLSPRSSARSFLHEIETSIRHVGIARPG